MGLGVTLRKFSCFGRRVCFPPGSCLRKLLSFDSKLLSFCFSIRESDLLLSLSLRFLKRSNLRIQFLMFLMLPSVIDFSTKSSFR